MGIGRNSLDHSLSNIWGRQKLGKVEVSAKADTDPGAGSKEGQPGQSGEPANAADHGLDAATIVHLFTDQAWAGGDPADQRGPVPNGPVPNGPVPNGPASNGMAHEPPPAAKAPPHAQAPQAQPAPPSMAPQANPAWADHPITKALERLYEGPTNPLQIIADSIRPAGLREGQAYQEWFPLEPPAPAAPTVPDDVPVRALDPEPDLHAEFWRVWSGHQDFLLKQCIRLMAGNMADAEDALSSAMLRASRKYNNYSDSIVNERAWLSRLVHNVCIDHYRRQRRTEYRDPHEDAGADIVSTMFADAQPTPEDVALEREQLRALDAELGQLSAQLRIPLMMRFVEGLSYPEIAERLNIRADTVRKRIQLARDHLKRADIR